MAISKVIYGGNTLIDLTNDTVTADKLLIGYTAHGADGEKINGACPYDAYTSDATATAAELLKGKTAYRNGEKFTGTMPNNAAVHGLISAKSGLYNIPQGYHDGGGYVEIEPTEQAKLIPENIRQGVTILGVEGSMTGTEDAVAETITVTPTVEARTVLPDAEKGYNYIAQVTVAAIPYTESENNAGGTTVTIA